MMYFPGEPTRHPATLWFLLGVGVALAITTYAGAMMAAPHGTILDHRWTLVTGTIAVLAVGWAGVMAIPERFRMLSSIAYSVMIIATCVGEVVVIIVSLSVGGGIDSD